MATIRRRVDGKGRVRFQAMIRVSGKPAETKTFNSKGAAVKWGRNREDEIRVGGASKDAQTLTFGELLPEYLLHIQLKDLRTVAKLTSQLAIWESLIGKYAIAHIDGDLISRHRDHLARDKSKPTANRYLAALSGFFSWVIEDRSKLGITVNPCARRKLKGAEHGRERRLSDDERRRLLEAAAVDPRMHVIVNVALFTGMRQSEIMGLKWRDVDLVDGTVTLYDTKNKTSRSVTLHGPALETLRAWSKVRRLGDDRVFPFAFPRARWASLLKRAELDGGEFVFHSLRHSFGYMLGSTGASTLKVAAAMGHKSLVMAKRYANLSSRDAETEVRSMVERYSS